MYLRSIALALGASCLLAACATETQNTAHAHAELVANNAPTDNTTDPNRMICQSVEVTGSRFPQKECHTAAQWEIIHHQGQDELTNIAAHGNGLSSH